MPDAAIVAIVAIIFAGAWFAGWLHEKGK